MQIRNPFHDGERQVQQRAGEAMKAERGSGMIADTIMAGALPFLRQQQILVVGSVSPRGDLWASSLFGPPGFVESEDQKTLRIHLDKATRDGEDPLWSNVALGKNVGGLAIDLATRHRLRLNGRVAMAEPDLLAIEVDEVYPNCPKYIQRRHLRLGSELHPPRSRSTSGNSITGVARDVIEEADTLFVASANPHGGVDVSHRGGQPGFVSVLNDQVLSVPDYQGNSMFNTLGNFALNPASGILIVDFKNHQILQMTGKATIHWGQPVSVAKGQTGRSWTFHVSQWLLRPLPASVEWEFVDFSPYNPS